MKTVYNDLVAMLIVSVTIILILLIFSPSTTWAVVLATVIILTILILAVVGRVDELSDVLDSILEGLREIIKLTLKDFD